MSNIWIIIPVYNEISRGSSEYWKELTSRVNANFVFVDDFSADGSGEYLAHNFNKINSHVIRHSWNQGKAEAIRTGFNYCFSQCNQGLVGFLDADGAFTVTEVERVIQISEKQILLSNYDSIWTSRVQMAGRIIKRKKARHITGRLISTVLGLVDSSLPYDTQSGYKFFLISDNLKIAIKSPFLTRWFFDIELLQRMKSDDLVYSVREEGLEEWYEMGNSSIKLPNYLHIARELITILKVLKNGS